MNTIIKVQGLSKEEHLQMAAEIGRTDAVPVEELAELLKRFYQGEE